MKKKILVGNKEPDRLDRYLAENHKLATRSQIKQAIEQGLVLVNEERKKPNYKAMPGDRIVVDIPDEDSKVGIAPETKNLHILYEDSQLLVVFKPAGMLTHPTKHTRSGTLVNILLDKYPKIDEVGQATNRPGIVHRLDKDTSGAIVVAKTNLAYKRLKKMFKDRLVKKVYISLCSGWPDDETGTLKSFISREKNLHFDDLSLEGKKAISKYRVSKIFHTEQKEKVSEVIWKIETGRTHQIRIHAKRIKTPVLGDNVYGNKKSISTSKRLGVKRQLLHAKDLEFRHPTKEGAVKVVAPAPKDYQQIEGSLKQVPLDL